MTTIFKSTLIATGLAVSALAMASPSQAASHVRRHVVSQPVAAAPAPVDPGPITDTDSSDPALAQAAAYGRMIWPQNRDNVAVSSNAAAPAPDRRFLSGTTEGTTTASPGAVTDTDSSDPALAQAASYGRMIWPQKGMSAW